MATTHANGYIEQYTGSGWEPVTYLGLYLKCR